MCLARPKLQIPDACVVLSSLREGTRPAVFQQAWSTKRVCVCLLGRTKALGIFLHLLEPSSEATAKVTPQHLFKVTSVLQDKGGGGGIGWSDRERPCWLFKDWGTKIK